MDKDRRTMEEILPEQVKKQADAVTELKRHFDEQERCNVFGVLPLNRVTGQLIFNSQQHYYVIQKFIQQYPDYATRVQMNHEIKGLTFGEDSQHKSIQ